MRFLRQTEAIRDFPTLRFFKDNRDNRDNFFFDLALSLTLNQRIVPIVSIVFKKNAFNVVLKKPIVLQNNRLDLALLLNLNQRIVLP